MKVVYNADFGGFSFSEKACERLIELGVRYSDRIGSHDVIRHDPKVVQVVEEMGAESSGKYARLKVHTLSGRRYLIEEYDGLETVKEPEDIEWAGDEEV